MKRFGVVLAVMAMLVVLALLVPMAPRGQSSPGQGSGSTTAVRAEIQPISASLFDMTAAGPGYYILFELIGVLLLVAVVAAVLLAKRRLDDPTPAAEEKKEDAHGHH